EGGIRARHVTGVQTCALPIWPTSSPSCAEGPAEAVGVMLRRCPKRNWERWLAGVPYAELMLPRGQRTRKVRVYNRAFLRELLARSEERSVGKGWSCRGRRQPV